MGTHLLYYPDWAKSRSGQNFQELDVHPPPFLADHLYIHESSFVEIFSRFLFVFVFPSFLFVFGPMERRLYQQNGPGQRLFATSRTNELSKDGVLVFPFHFCGLRSEFIQNSQHLVSLYLLMHWFFSFFIFLGVQRFSLKLVIIFLLVSFSFRDVRRYVYTR